MSSRCWLNALVASRAAATEVCVAKRGSTVAVGVFVARRVDVGLGVVVIAGVDEDVGVSEAEGVSVAPDVAVTTITIGVGAGWQATARKAKMDSSIFLIAGLAGSVVVEE